MKQIDNYFFDDAFEYKTETVFNTEMYSDGKHIYGDKQILLYNNAISRVCDICKQPTDDKYYTVCIKCRNTKQLEKYKALPESYIETPHMYSERFDIFFDKDNYDNLLESMLELCANIGADKLRQLKFEDLLIYPCKDSIASTIDIANLFEEAPVDFDLQTYNVYEELSKVIDSANLLISKNPVGYEPDYSYRITMSDEDWKSLVEDTICVYNESEEELY